MDGAHYLGVDIGTSGTKALLMDETGRVLATATEEYPLHVPKPNWSEQDPGDWWRATVVSIRSVLEKSGVSPDSVRGLGLSGQMHGSVFLDASSRVIRPAILWNDQRTGEECAEITERVGAERLLELVSNPALAGFTAPKILWLRKHEPENYRRVTKVLLPKDYVRFRLTGEFATEVSDASGTLLFDVRNRRWSEQVLDELEIPAEWMPPAYESP
ncbi:MAG TPA: xylulokinase, partial [Bacteroidetes bacterium]|nr:xylulokinase [Bacteroidota bacterium]